MKELAVACSSTCYPLLDPSFTFLPSIRLPWTNERVLGKGTVQILSS